MHLSPALKGAKRFIVVLLLISASAAHGGQLRVNSRPLWWVIDAADMIVVARPAEPRTRSQVLQGDESSAIHVDQQDQQDQQGNLATVTYLRYEIGEVLAPREGQVAGGLVDGGIPFQAKLSPAQAYALVGRVIEALALWDRAKLTRPTKKETRHKRGWGTVARYQQEHPGFGANDDRILLLRGPHEDGTFTLIGEDGVETRASIEQLLRAGRERPWETMDQEPEGPRPRRRE